MQKALFFFTVRITSFCILKVINLLLILVQTTIEIQILKSKIP